MAAEKKTITLEYHAGHASALQALVNETCENICDNFCKYRETSDVNAECDYIRNGAHECPLSKIYC